jgi:bifunctional N-acetylglucosamine-1-phosphate-uridyltransferase/glucosamine-1-phosphate-acetyltransferase GlmU-like protein
MIRIDDFINYFSLTFSGVDNLQPWEITKNLSDIIRKKIERLDGNFVVKNGIAIHKTATIEERAILKAPIIISENCFIGANAYLRNGVYLGKASSVGPSCEVKTSIIFNETEIAHLNFIGDSIIGSNINFEAGSITTNYFNERTDKIITVLYNSKMIRTNTEKFGSLVGDNCKIGANAVLSPGTILTPDIVVKRLELIEQLK